MCWASLVLVNVFYFSEGLIGCDYRHVPTICCSDDIISIRPLLNPKRFLLEQLYLHLSRIRFPYKELKRNWLGVDFELHYLKLSNIEISSISSDAFDSPAFIKLGRLELIDLPLKSLPDGGLTGLPCITAIKMQNLQLDSFPMCFAAAIQKDSLSTFVMNNCTRKLKGITDSSCGSRQANLRKLFIINNDLKHEITDNIFYGFRAIHIELQSNMIENIGRNAFVPFAETLEFLRLSHNRLKVLPVGIFDFLRLRSPNEIRHSIRISLINNPWDCTCKLEYLRRCIQEFRSIFVAGFLLTMECSTPFNKMYHNIDSLPNLCTANDQYVIEVGKLSNANTSTSNDTSQSFSTQNIIVKQSSKYLYSLAIKEFPLDYFLLGFENDELMVHKSHYKGSSCMVKTNDGESRNVTVWLKLKPNQTYRFCLMRKRSSQPAKSQMSCVSFHSKAETKNDWILAKYRTIVIPSCEVAGSIAFLFGFLLSLVVAKRFRNPICPRLKPVLNHVAVNTNTGVHNRSSPQPRPCVLLLLQYVQRNFFSNFSVF